MKTGIIINYIVPHQGARVLRLDAPETLPAPPSADVSTAHVPATSHRDRVG